MLASRLLLSFSLIALTACSSKIKSALDPALQGKVDTVRNCIPPQLDKLNELIGFADLWRLNGGNNPADPVQLTWTENGSGAIDYSVALTSFTISGQIVFYSPAGAVFDANIVAAPGGSLSQAIDDAATQMRATFLTGRPFMVGSWTITGASVSGSGAFTGMIAGSTNGNELEELITTTTTVSGGPPANANGTITTTGSETCVFTFNTASLLTDESPTQAYPIGVITFTLNNQTAGVAVTGTLTLDGTVTARLTVATISGRFDINIETLSVTYVP